MNRAPDWLSRLRDDMALITREAAIQHWPGPTANSPPYFNYRLEHVRQVERDALRLLAEVGGDWDVVLASVWIHDRFQPQYVGSDHASRGAEWASQHLVSLGFPQDKVEAVAFAVANHSNAPHTLPPDAKEAQLLWDADKLSKIGAASIVARLSASPAYPHEVVTYTGIAQIGLDRMDAARSRVDVFYFEISRVWALERFNVQRAFYDALAREVDLWQG